MLYVFQANLDSISESESLCRDSRSYKYKRNENITDDEILRNRTADCRETCDACERHCRIHFYLSRPSSRVFWLKYPELRYVTVTVCGEKLNYKKREYSIWQGVENTYQNALSWARKTCKYSKLR